MVLSLIHISALMMGLNVRRIKLKAYVLDGFLCGVGSILFCLNTLGGFVEQAKGFEMDAIASSVIGGTLLTGGVGNVFGTLFEMCIRDRDKRGIRIWKRSFICH